MADQPPRSLGLDILDAVGSGELSGVEHERLHREYLNALYAFVKSAFVYEINNEAVFRACERVAAVVNRIRKYTDGVAGIGFRPDGVYVNRTLLKLDAAGYEHGEYVVAVFGILGVAEIAAIDDTVTADWLMLLAEFKRCVGPGGVLAEFRQVDLPAIRLYPFDDANAVEGLAVTDRFRALRAYATAVITIGDLLEHARNGRRIRPAAVKRPLQELIALAHESRPILLSLTHLKRHKQGVHHHLANTAVLAICAATRLELSRGALIEVAMQAVLHDLGRAFVAAGQREDGPAAERGFALETVRKLVQNGVVSLRSVGRVVVANEVRRWARDEPASDDTAYPFTPGAASRLIAVAHAYSLLTTATADRPALLPDEALRVIMAESGRRYDAVAVKLVANTLGVYPVGSVVALSDGRTAIVTEAPRDAAGPTRPRIKVVRDAVGVTVDGELVDLAGDAGADLHILHCVDAEEEEINTPAFLLG